MALLRQPCVRLSRGVLAVDCLALPTVSQFQLPGPQGANRASQLLAERWASSAGASSSGSSFTDVLSRRFLQRPERWNSWPQFGGMSRRTLSAQQVAMPMKPTACLQSITRH